MADLNDDDHLFEEMSPESPSTIGRNIERRLGLASQVAEAIRSPNNNTCYLYIKSITVLHTYVWSYYIHTSAMLPLKHTTKY